MKLYQTQRRDYLCFLLLIIAGIIVYLPVLSNQLLDFWDDQWAVMNHYTEGGVNWANIWAILTEFYHGQYAPLNEYLYLFLYTFWGYDPFYYHLASMLLHLINICLVFVVLKKLFILSGRFEEKNIVPIVFLTTLMFAVHPLNVEAVAWMSASKILVYALFYLWATYTFLLFLEKKKWKYYVFTILLYVLSFLGKDQVVTFPLWMLLIYWFVGRDIRDKFIWKATAPFWVFSILFGVVTMLSQSATNQGMLSEEEVYPLWQRFVFAFYSFFEYITKSILPIKLSYMYPFPNVMGDPLPNWLLIYPALTIIIVVALWRYLKCWYIAFGLLLFFIHIAIVLNFLPLSRFSMIADRYVYISLIGICFLLSYLFVKYLPRLKGFRRMLLVLLFTAYIIYLGFYANQRVGVWYNTDSLKKEIRGLLQERNDYELYKHTH